jgi:hypothetical protein
MRAPLKTWALVSLVLLPGLWASASPLRAPRRIINGQTVSLDPLFQWWTNHHGARPLSAWVHITGTVVGTNAWGWIVEAQVEKTDRPNKPEPSADAETNGPGKILLGNPPLMDRTEFELLSAQLKALNQEHATIASQEAQARDRAQTLTNERNSTPQNRVQTRVVSQMVRQLHQLENQAKAELKWLDEQIKVLKTRLAPYPNSDHYVLDCFALDTGQEQSQMRIYDHGGVQ